MLAYGIAAIAAFISEEFRSVKLILALGLLVVYIFYMVRTLTAEGDSTEDGGTNSLYLIRSSRSLPEKRRKLTRYLQCSSSWHRCSFRWPSFVLGATIFVHQVSDAAAILGISPLILSLLISPLATELPEMFNSIIWVREDKDVFAVGNILGAMVYQSCILAFIGINLTPWHFNPGDPTQLLQIISIGISFCYLPQCCT